MRRPKTENIAWAPGTNGAVGIERGPEAVDEGHRPEARGERTGAGPLHCSGTRVSAAVLYIGSTTGLDRLIADRSPRQVQHLANGCLNLAHEYRGTHAKRPGVQATIVDGAQLIDQKIGIVFQPGERLDPKPERFRVIDQVGREWNDQS